MAAIDGSLQLKIPRACESTDPSLEVSARDLEENYASMTLRAFPIACLSPLS